MPHSISLTAVYDTTVRWMRSAGCLPLLVQKEISGFCFNLVWGSIKKEELHLWPGNFVDFKDMDRAWAWMLFTGMGFGPFGVMAKIGSDVVYDIEMQRREESKDPADYLPERLINIVKRAEFGQRQIKGFASTQIPSSHSLASWDQRNSCTAKSASLDHANNYWKTAYFIDYSEISGE